jgi:hypothetical protein
LKIPTAGGLVVVPKIHPKLLDVWKLLDMIEIMLHGKNVIKWRTWKGGTPELYRWAFIRVGQGKIYQTHQGESDIKPEAEIEVM